MANLSLHGSARGLIVHSARLRVEGAYWVTRLGKLFHRRAGQIEQSTHTCQVQTLIPLLHDSDGPHEKYT